MKIYGITFKEKGKNYNFKSEDATLSVGQYAIVETEKGLQLGKISTISNNLNQPLENIKPIIRKATTQDYNNYLKNIKDATDVLKKTKELVEKLKLNMQPLDASYTFDRKQLVINFISDERIDFRELVKQLASIYKTRIDLHQMGIRDKARETGGIGPCGRELCCKSFLNKLDTITINMAKNQNIALNPSKINGCCGRLLCCLSYEDETYTCQKKNLPSVGKNIKYNGKECKVVSVDVLNQTYKIEYENEIMEVKANEENNHK